LRREAFSLLLISLVALAQPWAVPGFKAVYEYEANATGMLALQAKHTKGIAIYEILNITEDKIYINITIKAKVTMLNGRQKDFVKSMVTPIPRDKSFIFLTNESLNTLKREANLTCVGYICTAKLNNTLPLANGLTMKVYTENTYNLKEMLLQRSFVHTEVYTTTGGRLLGKLDNKTELIKAGIGR